MSLILHMKIPGAIIAASDCRVTGTELIDLGKYNYIKSDNEQKTFLINSANKLFAVSYCGNANLKGYPASFFIKKAIRNMGSVNTTYEIAEKFNRFWTDYEINLRPSLLVSGYNNGKQTVIEVKTKGEIVEHFSDEESFGVTFHGEQDVASALINLGGFEYSLFRFQDAINFCKLIITTAKIQSFQKKQQTVSENCDILVITEDKSVWVERGTFDF